MPAEAKVLPKVSARTALAIEKREGKWHVLELTIVGKQVISEVSVDSAYYRDLIEQAANRRMRSLGR